MYTVESRYLSAPGHHQLLTLLDEAGPGGLLIGELARSFTEPADLGARNRWCNTALNSMQRRGFTRHGEHRERSPYYHGTPSWRWFITPAGSQYVARGMQTEWMAARDEAMIQAAWAARDRAAALAAARAAGARRGVPACVRERIVLELRAVRCTLAEIGDLFGISRERVRQIEAGISVSPCRCGNCGPGTQQHPQAGPRGAAGRDHARTAHRVSAGRS